MNRWATLRHQAATWALVLGLWLLLVLAFASQLVFVASLEWSQALRISMRDWVPWIGLGPAVAWLAHQFPFERGKVVWSVPVHLAACLLSILACELVTRPVRLPPSIPEAEATRGPAEVPPPHFRAGERPPGPMPPAPARPPGPPQPHHLFFMEVRRAEFNLPIYWIIVAVMQALRYQRRSQERERKAMDLETRLSEAKLQALRMQLHPHFLFNTLNTISTLVHKDPKAADEMIGNLSELLRLALDTSDQQEISLREEMGFLDRYLEIQQVRFGDRLSVTKEIASAALNGLVPTFILQPLVENAIRHGIESSVEPGKLSLQADVVEGRLRVTVRDNGAGVQAAARSEGVGLSNTRARLEQLYGQWGEFTIENLAPNGCLARLEIPFHEQPLIRTIPS